MHQSNWQMKHVAALGRPELDDESARAAENISRLISAARRNAWLVAAFCLASVADLHVVCDYLSK
jgi:hypothetical protein